MAGPAVPALEHLQQTLLKLLIEAQALSEHLSHLTVCARVRVKQGLVGEHLAKGCQPTPKRQAAANRRQQDLEYRHLIGRIHFVQMLEGLDLRAQNRRIHM